MPILLAIPFLVAALIAGLALVISGLRMHRKSNARPDPNAGLADTLRAVPLRLVIGLDLLDFSLDVFAAPLTWLLLDRVGLKSLRNVASIEAIIPFTQPIPTMTLCWLGVRAMDRLSIATFTPTPAPAAAAQAPSPGRRRVVNTAL